MQTKTKMKPLAAGVKLSNAGKMPCKSWSLQAIDTCPGSVDKTHPSGLVEACRGCYATEANYRFPNVKNVRIHNQEDWRRPEWIVDMVAAIGNDSYFRWFDSGDVYSLALANKIHWVMKLTPNTKHWLPTRMHKFAKFRQVLEAMQSLENVVVRYSSDDTNGATIAGRNTSTIFDASKPAPLHLLAATTCGAYARQGKCGDCRACWDKTVKVIAYPQHGQKMAKIQRDMIATDRSIAA